jgi:hypothetical protein
LRPIQADCIQAIPEQFLDFLGPVPRLDRFEEGTFLAGFGLFIDCDVNRFALVRADQFEDDLNRFDEARALAADDADVVAVDTHHEDPAFGFADFADIDFRRVIANASGDSAEQSGVIHGRFIHRR